MKKHNEIIIYQLRSPYEVLYDRKKPRKGVSLRKPLILSKIYALLTSSLWKELGLKKPLTKLAKRFA